MLYMSINVETLLKAEKGNKSILNYWCNPMSNLFCHLCRCQWMLVKSMLTRHLHWRCWEIQLFLWNWIYRFKLRTRLVAFLLAQTEFSRHTCYIVTTIRPTLKRRLSINLIRLFRCRCPFTYWHNHFIL